jgi:hypothetical protein
MNKEELRKPSHGDMTTSKPNKRIEEAWEIEVTLINFLFNLLIPCSLLQGRASVGFRARKSVPEWAKFRNAL